MSSRRLEALKRRLASLTPEELAEVLEALPSQTSETQTTVQFASLKWYVPRHEQTVREASDDEPVQFIPFTEAGFPAATKREPGFDSVAYQRKLRDEWPD